MNKNRKIIMIAIVATFILSSFVVVTQAASEATNTNYYYTIANGWENVYPIDGDTIDGAMDCGYKQGVLIRPQIKSRVSGYGAVNHVGLDLYMWTVNEDRYEVYDTASSSLELTLKAPLWADIRSTWHWGKVYGTNGEYADVQAHGQR